MNVYGCALTALQKHRLCSTANTGTALMSDTVVKPDSHGPCMQSGTDGSQEDVVGSVNAHLIGLTKQFASQTDAFLLVQGEQFHVHRAFLAVASTTFCGLFETAQAENLAAGKSKEDKLCVPLAGHTIENTSIALKFVYQRVVGSLTDAPSRQLWQSVGKARPVIEFAHKFDMRSILEEADTCLSEAAQIQDDEKMLDSTDDIVAWANLAHDYCLKKLLSEVELVMLRSNDTDLWQSSVAQQLPQACQWRVLRAAQQNRRAQHTYGIHAVDSDTLLKWQECGSNQLQA